MRRIGKRLIVTCVSLSMILQSFAPATNALAATINAAAEAGSYSTTDGAPSETGDDTLGETGSPKDDAANASPDTGENTGEDTSGADQVTDGAEGSQEETAAAEDAAADEGEVEAQTQGAYQYNTLDELTPALSKAPETANGEIAKLESSNLAQDLKALSNAAPALYKNAIIVASQTGDAIDLSADFNGLGGSNEDDAFAGTITGNGGAAVRIRVKRPLFNGLKVSTEQKYLIEWAAGDSQHAVLANRAYGFEGAIANVTVYGVSGSTEKLTAPIIATLQGNLTAKVTLDQSTVTSVSITSSTNSIGVVAGTVESGTLTIGELNMPGVTKVTVDASSNADLDQKNGNAGMLVGRVADGAGLTIDAEITAPSGDIKSVTGKDNASAGAVVGKLGGGDGGNATPVVVNKSIDVSALAVTGAISGGFVGRAVKLSLSFGEGASIAPAKKLEATQASGGLFGWVDALAEDLKIAPSNLKMPNDGISIRGATRPGSSDRILAYAGGLFGYLASDSGGLSILAGTNNDRLQIKVSVTDAKPAVSFQKGAGGIIGRLGGDSPAAKVIVNVSDADVDLTSDVNFYVGGVIGNCWGSSVVKSDGVSVTAAVSSSATFGGVVGVTRAKKEFANTVLVNNLKVATANDKPIASGGGVVGRANCNTLIRLSGTTDLSGVYYKGSNDSGQITSLNTANGFEGPLVFATGNGNDQGWTLIRGKNEKGDRPELDDIGGYGEVVRLSGKLSKDFLMVDESTGMLTIKNSDKSAATISNEEDFARLAITWSTKGVFMGASDGGWDKMNITLTNDIDLTGTGIYGLSREGMDGDTPFVKTIDGGGHSITLSIGEAYGTWDGTNKVADNDAGNGRIYRHKQLGLFAAGNGSASNLTIDGTINVDTKIDGMAVGAFAATCTSSNDLSFNNVVCKTKMNIKANNKMFVGGFIGKTSTSNRLAFAGGSSFAGKITMSIDDKAEPYIGGAIGYIDGDSTPTIAVDDMKLSGSISAQTNRTKLCAGGLIGFIDQAEDDNKTKTVTISGLDLGGLKLDFSAAGDASAAGGYLGSTWAQTNVTIEGSSSTYAIKASKEASLKTGSAKFVGGLVYHAGGVWTANSKAIDFNNVGIESKATELGLLVCRGGRGKEDGISNGEMGGLYLNVTKNWANAVSFDGINLTGTEPAAMDEWVADTRGYGENNAGDIFTSGKNGVVSLTTKSGLVAMGDNDTRNTYENQTDWGKKHHENGNTRYYYNLNRVAGSVGQGDGAINTPEELLLWSVRHYADSALRAEFNKGDAECETITGTLNMKGYSYYPVDIANCSVNINNATITFWNKQIETLESGSTKNKLTSESSQHQAMHCGLIRNYSSSGNQGGQTLSVKTLTLSGTVGPMNTNGGSGALICGTAWGEAAATTTVSLEGITLKNLAVTDFAANKDKSLPLLVNAGGSHLSLSVNDLSCTGYTAVGENNTVASSLMGNMGGEDKTGINLSFSNIEIPSYTGERIFSSALLMMSFGYKTDGSGSASYNFTADDTRVTYGQEIDGTKEYGNNDGDMQCWYFDAKHEGCNLVKDEKHDIEASEDKSAPRFGNQAYLKYVTNGRDDNHPWRHEVAVNHSAAKLIKGCGTYTDPYVISSAKNLRDAANIIQGASASGSEVNITTNQDAACSGESGHGKFVSSGSTWVCGNTSYTTETVSRYLRSAYYVIDKDITVNAKDFSGLGQTPERAFRGVIVGKNSATLTIKNDNDSKKQFMGLIPYSYGSVVKNLKIRYEGEKLSIAYTAPKDQTPKDQTTKDQTPKAFFGGVMGCVLGGDNIVDGVTVSAADGFSVDGVSKNTPIGGYVGVVAGGGVLFRNMSENSWHTAGDSLYDNAFLGRMLNGYAFSENCTVDNGERNYKINKLSGTKNLIATTDLTGATDAGGAARSVSVSSAEGLLVLSGIINSGAAAGYGTRAYDGASGDQEGLKLGNALYGKVRNAQYDQVGNQSLDANNSEWLAAKQDDQSAPSAGNTAYLVTAYADAGTGNICAGNTAYVEFSLNDASFDMTSYSTGYLGLSARYVSNAGIDRSGKSQPTCVMPSVAAVKGSADASTNTTLKVKLDVKEYKTDDYHLLGVGGLFGVANFRTPGKTGDGKYTFDPDTYSIISNLTIGESNISLSYVDAAGDSTNKAFDGVALSDDAEADIKYKNIVGVGGVAGALAPNDSKYMGGQVTNFTSSGLTINSPSSAGSLFGYAGAANLSADGQYLAKTGGELTNMTMRLVNCGFSKLNITADRDAGGFFGYLVTKKSDNKSKYSGVWNTEETTYGTNSIIASNGKVLLRKDHNIGENKLLDYESRATGVGGFVGHVKNSFNVNAWSGGGSTVVKGLTLDNDRNAYDAAGTGGLVGIYEEAVDGCTCVISGVQVISAEGAKTVIKGCKFAGGIIGLVSKGRLHAITVDNVSIDAVEMPKSNTSIPVTTPKQLTLGYKGAVIGGMNGASGQMTLSNSTVSNMTFDDERSGFVIGCIGSGISTIYTLNSRFENNTLNAGNSGALVGHDAGKVYGQNILIRNLTYAKASSQGLLLGSLYIKAGNAEPGVCVAGFDLQLGTGQTYDSIPTRLAVSDDTGFNGRSFVAYADYNDNAKTDGSSVTSGALDAEAADPYATTSPSNELTVATSDGSSKRLFGDSMLPSTAKTIQEEKDSKDAGKFHYTSAPSADFSNTVSTMSQNNDGTEITNNFDVLQVSSGNEQVITNYLDTVTNGGYSKAKDLGYVTASATTYAYDDAGKQFVAPTEGTAAASMKQALEVTGSGSSLGYSVTSGYDNGLMRITLLTVKIGYAKDSKTGVVNKGYYVLHVPIVVRRMLEVDFTATLTGGTVFNKTAYANLGKDAHVLESYGSSMTGLLTYTYNSAVGERMEYGWDGYLADGGSMGATDKTLVFASSGEKNGNYPVGTRLTLLDCAHNNKEYHYKVEDENGISSLSLSEFKDAAGKSYEQRWLSDLMGVTAKTDPSGKWVNTDEASATASGKLKDGTVAYFRPATKEDTDDRYSLTVAKGDGGKEQSPSESFYLVVRFPKDDQATAAAVVGKLKSSLSFAEGASIATRVNQVLRPKYDNKVVEDDMANSASTYSILTGYKQALTDNDTTAGPSVPELTDSGHTVKLDVTDTVTFNSSQVYNGEDDPLYYELSTTLGQGATVNGAANIVGSGGFPSGMSGTVAFYAQVGDTYYVYSKDGGWTIPETSGGDPAPSGLSYVWASDGGEMELLLGSANSEASAVSLAGLRDAAKDAGQTSFTIRAQITIEMTDEAFTKAIAASSNSGTDNWTQMVFRGQLATKVDQLAYTSLTYRAIGNHKYYREGSAYSTISLTASLPSQLGINIDDLRQATADGTIGTVATYDLSSASNVDELLNKAQSVTFTATLMKRSDTAGNYESADITKVMSGGDKPRTNSTVLGSANKGSKSYSWTDTKDAKRADGTFSTLNGQKFELPIDFVVDTTKDAQVYANYRIVVTAEIRNANGDVINTPGNTSDFVTFTLTRVNTKGIQ